jgi:hypothetical protein
LSRTSTTAVRTSPRRATSSSRRIHASTRAQRPGSIAACMAAAGSLTPRPYVHLRPCSLASSPTSTPPGPARSRHHPARGRQSQIETRSWNACCPPAPWPSRLARGRGCTTRWTWCLGGDHN